MINPDDWKMAERIAENSTTFITPQEAIAAFEDLMKQVKAEGELPSENQHYRISSNTWLAMCCNEIMFKYTCRKCDEQMGCYYCDFNYDEAHECD